MPKQFYAGRELFDHHVFIGIRYFVTRGLRSRHHIVADAQNVPRLDVQLGCTESWSRRTSDVSQTARTVARSTGTPCASSTSTSESSSDPSRRAETSSITF